MLLFQKLVGTKQLKSHDKNKIAAPWEIFKNHFHNPVVQDNIRGSK